jgi:transcriptional antiterminator RfaH
MFSVVRTIGSSMWHVLHTAPNCEQKVYKFLAVQGLEAYAPQLPAPRGTRAGSVRAQRRRWLFPAYVFVKLPEEFAQWDLVRSAPGVRRMLQEDGGPAVVSESVIEHLRRRIAERSLWQRGPRFVRGQAVSIDSGPLAALDAIFDRHLDAPARVQVLVRLLGRQILVRIDPAVLRAAG